MLPTWLCLALFVALSAQWPVTNSTMSFPNSTKEHRPDWNSTKPRGPLTFDDEGNFQISVFEDLHFGENAWDVWGPKHDDETVKVMDSVISKESPNLVVLNGDLITGDNAFLENNTAVFDKLARPLLDHNLRWASTYGNHDYAFNLSGVDILQKERRFVNALTDSMIQGLYQGVSNYYLPVYAPDCQDSHCAPQLLLWFFDSRGGSLGQKRNPGKPQKQRNWVDVEVVAWFRQASARLAQGFGRTIPSLAFVHIPTTASLRFQEEQGRNSLDPNLYPGINDDYPLAAQGQGWCADGTNDKKCETSDKYGGSDEPFMKAITSTPGLLALFSGHDHGDSWCFKWERRLPNITTTGNGINLCFGQRSGYGGYGSWIRGSRQIRVSRGRLNSSSAVDTWIRLENGDVVGSVSLNATYGTDRYPATPNTETYCATCND